MPSPASLHKKIIHGYRFEKLPMIQIAKILDCSKSGVYYQLIKYKIKRRKIGRKRTYICSRGKYCSICGLMLPLDYFALAKNHTSGRKSECKNCKNKITRERSKLNKCNSDGAIPIRPI